MDGGGATIPGMKPGDVIGAVFRRPAAPLLTPSRRDLLSSVLGDTAGIGVSIGCWDLWSAGGLVDATDN